MTTEITSDPLNSPSTKDNVIYQRDLPPPSVLPEFKPGSTPYTQYGNETLNANIPWYQIIQEILTHYTQEQLLEETGLVNNDLLEILNQNYCKLNFKMGAKLLRIHSCFYPEQY